MKYQVLISLAVRRDDTHVHSQGRVGCSYSEHAVLRVVQHPSKAHKVHLIPCGLAFLSEGNFVIDRYDWSIPSSYMPLTDSS